MILRKYTEHNTAVYQKCTTITTNNNIGHTFYRIYIDPHFASLKIQF